MTNSTTPTRPGQNAPTASDEQIITVRHWSQTEVKGRAKLGTLFDNCPIPTEERVSNLGLFMRRQDMSRVLFMNELYQKILPVQGVVLEFGTRWGQNLALFESFRGIYEPYNHNRRFVAFDTFEGFPSVHAKDGKADVVQVGALGVTKGYENYLDEVLAFHEGESPISHIRKYKLIKGDATKTLPRYLEEHPETVIAMAYFDLDLYEPTKACLEMILPRLTKGSVIGFDELGQPDWPGETLAVKEVFGLGRYAITRSRYGSVQSFIVVD